MEILGPSAHCLYRSKASIGTLPQVTIRCPGQTKTGGQDDLLITRAFEVPHGQTFLYTSSNSGFSSLNWRGSWSNILHDTFHEDADALLQGEVSSLFATYIECMSFDQIFPEHTSEGRTDKHRPERMLIDPLSYVQEAGSGRVLELASQRLPELATVVHLGCPAISRRNSCQLSRDSFDGFEKACSCFRCGKGVIRGKWCLKTIAKTVVVLIRIILSCTIDEGIHPSITGLANLYSQLSRDNSDNVSLDPGIRLILQVLTGSPRPLEIRFPLPVALVGDGLCVYRIALEDPTLALRSVFRFRVMQGYIAYDGARFTSIEDSRDRSPPEKSILLDDVIEEIPILSIKAIVREDEKHAQLQMVYLIKFLDREKKMCEEWLELGRMFTMFGCVITTVRWSEDCQALDELERPPFAYHAWRNPKYIADKTVVDLAHRAVHDFMNTENTWILYTEESHSPFEVTLIFLDTTEPIRLYLYIANYAGPMNFQLASFSKCLSCMFERGCQAVAKTIYLGCGRDKMPVKGKATILKLAREPIKFEWTTKDEDETIIPSAGKLTDQTQTPCAISTYGLSQATDVLDSGFSEPTGWPPAQPCMGTSSNRRASF